MSPSSSGGCEPPRLRRPTRIRWRSSPVSLTARTSRATILSVSFLPRRAPAAPALGRQRAFFADLRGSLDHQEAAELPPDAIPSHAPPVAASDFAAEEEYADPAAWADQEAAYAEPQARAQRSRRPLYA